MPFRHFRRACDPHSLLTSHHVRGLPMRLVFAVALLALISTIPVGAEEDPARAIRWSWTLQPADAAPGSEAELVLVAQLAPHWVVYSSDFQADFGPLPTRLRKKPQRAVQLLAGFGSVNAAARRTRASTSNTDISRPAPSCASA